MRSYGHLKKGHFSHNFWNIGKNWDNPGHKFRTLLHLLLDFRSVFINWIDWYSGRNVCILPQMAWKPVWMYNRVFWREFLRKLNLHIKTMAITAGGPIVYPKLFFSGFPRNYVIKWGDNVLEVGPSLLGRQISIYSYMFFENVVKNTTF